MSSRSAPIEDAATDWKRTEQDDIIVMFERGWISATLPQNLNAIRIFALP